MNSSYRTSLLLMHFVGLIYGSTAILGKLITMPAIQLVWYRMGWAALGLWIYLKITKQTLRIPPKQLLTFLGIGVIVVTHWIAFFHAIKISNISITLGIISTGALFTSFLEPLFFRKKINPLEVVVGLLIIIGLYLILSYELHYIKGILVALAATILASVFTILNKKYANDYSASVISFYEMLGGIIGLSIYLGVTNGYSAAFFSPTLLDMSYLAILGLLCTAFAFVASVQVMKNLSAYTVMLLINMEPIYGILSAILIFGESEQMTGGFYVGLVVILAAVFLFPFLSNKLKKYSVNV